MQDLIKKYDVLKEKLNKIGLICIGSINTVYTKCGNHYCKCSTDTSKMHGPYYTWTRKKNNKTISKRLSKKQAAKCLKYIDNYKKMRDVINKMLDISIEIAADEK